MGAVCALLLAGIAAGEAQYLDPRDEGPRELRFLSAGLAWRTFSPRASNPLAAGESIDLAAWMPMLGYRQGPVEVLFGYAPYTIRGARRSTVHFGTTATFDLRIATPPAAVSIPLLVAADYTKAEATGPQRDNFNIACLGGGAGVKVQTGGEGVRGALQAGAIVQFAFEGLHTGTGVSTLLLGEGMIVIPSVPIADGLVVGYRFRWQQWSMSRSAFNYRAITHGVYLGVLL
jgi:hypothetical protein